MMDPNSSYPGSGTDSFPAVGPPTTQFPSPEPPRDRHRGRMSFLLGALLVLLLRGGYAYATKGASPKAAPDTAAAAAGSSLAPATEQPASAGPSASPSPSTAPSSAKPSAKPSDAAAHNTPGGWPGPDNTGVPK